MRQVTAANGYVFEVHTVPDPGWLRIELGKARWHPFEEYAAYADGRDDPVGTLQFTRDDPEPGVVTFQQIGVSRDYQRRGVASALVERFHVDNPEAVVNISPTTEMGRALLNYGLAKEPEVRAYLYEGYVEKSVGY